MSAGTPQTPTVGRRLQDGALPGAENMARDAALLQLRESPTLRFYRWLRPTLSLGYFQAASALPIEDFRKRGYEVVRRSTGGKAILHQHELTYSLCLPETGSLRGGPAAAMAAIHLALSAELERQTGLGISLRDGNPESLTKKFGTPAPLQSDRPGSAWCFEDSSPLDLILEQRKLLGSAARRQRGWVLFHGSLVIQQPETNSGVAELGVEPDLDALAAALGKALGYAFQGGNWSAEELATAALIRAKKYACESFTQMR